MNSLNIDNGVRSLIQGGLKPKPQLVLQTPKKMRGVFGKLAETDESIRWFGDPVLRKISEEVSPNDFHQSIDVISRKMINVLFSIRGSLGIGRAIAAPQIGILKRVVVVLLESGGELHPNIYINPRVTSFSEKKAVYKELCLSGLPLVADVIRPYEVTVEYWELDGSNKQIQPDPMLARILQHEIDHLNGVLFIDRADSKSIQFIQDFDEYKANTTLKEI